MLQLIIVSLFVFMVCFIFGVKGWVWGELLSNYFLDLNKEFSYYNVL